MADHRVEQIMAAAQAVVTGLVTTAARVDRGRGDDIDYTKTPALRVSMGDDRIVDPWSHSLYDSELDLYIYSHAHSSASNIETLLNQVRKEVTIALMANQTLGLDFVHAIVEVAAARPELDGEGAKPTGRQELQFRVKYRRSVADPSA